MGRTNSPLGFVVALFDVLGFESRLKAFGLDEILKRYMNVVDFVNKNSERSRLIVDKLNIKAPIWTAEGIPAIIYDMRAAYASDSILLWANLAWPMVQQYSEETLKKNASHPAYGHFSNPIPLEPFLSMCAEIICKCIEIDLSLRGAIAMGDAIFDENNRIFLGSPLVEAAKLEKVQNCIGLSICNSLVEQGDHHKFFIPYSKHFKEDYKEPRKEFAFNWPLFWLNSRKTDIKLIVQNLAERNNNHLYYQNTLEFIKYSESFIRIV